jgi:hypothetical protein
MTNVQKGREQNFFAAETEVMADLLNRGRSAYRETIDFGVT